MARGIGKHHRFLHGDGTRIRRRSSMCGIVLLGMSAWLLLCPTAISASVTISPSRITSTACCVDGDPAAVTSRVIDIKGNGKDIPEVVRFSPRGEWLAVGTQGSVILYDASTLAPIWTRPSSGVGAFAFSPDGMTLAVSRVHGIDFLSIDDGKLLNRTDNTGPTDSGYALAFSPDGSLLAAGLVYGFVNVWSVTEAKLSLTLRDLTTPYGQMRYLIFSKDGTMLTAADIGRMDADAPSKLPSVHVWRVVDGSLVNTQAVPNYGYPVCLADGGNILIAVTAGALQRWRVETTGLSLIEDSGKSNRGYSSGSLSTDESVFVVGTRPGNFVTIWRFGDRRVEIMPGHTEEINSVAVSPDGHTIASASFDGTIRLSIVDFYDCSLQSWVHLARC